MLEHEHFIAKHSKRKRGPCSVIIYDVQPLRTKILDNISAFVYGLSISPAATKISRSPFTAFDKLTQAQQQQFIKSSGLIS